MKVNYKKTALTTVILIFIVMSFLVANRYYYGSFNVFSHPVRLIYDGFHYNHRSPKAVTLEEKPKIEITRAIDIITGKRLYAKNKDFNGPGKTIYLHIEGDNYISYSSGGGG